MMVLTLPWHLVGLLGMPRRMAYYDYTHPALHRRRGRSPRRPFGGLLLVVSAFLFVYILARRASEADVERRALHLQPCGARRADTRRSLLNGFGLWVAMMIGLTVVNYGFPIAQLASLKEAYGAGRSDREPVMQRGRHVLLEQPLVPLERLVAWPC